MSESSDKEMKYIFPAIEYMIGLGAKDEKGQVYGAEQAIDLENKGFLFILWKEGEENQEVVFINSSNMENKDITFELSGFTLNGN